MLNLFKSSFYRTMMIASTLTAGSLALSAAETQTLSPVKDPQAALARLHDRTTKMTFEMVGHGSCARWLLDGEANFKYTVLIQADSKILEKKKLPRGRYQVVEQHTIVMATDKLSVSDTDLSLRLDTFDSKRFDRYFNASCAIIATLSGPGASLGMVTTKNVAESYLKKFDGVSIKKV